MCSPSEKLGQDFRENKLYVVVIILWTVYAFLAVYWSVTGEFVENEQLNTLGKINLVAWICGPPVWFNLEHYFADDAQKKHIKDSRDMAAKIWAGVAAIMIFMLSTQL